MTDRPVILLAAHGERGGAVPGFHYRGHIFVHGAVGRGDGRIDEIGRGAGAEGEQQGQGEKVGGQFSHWTSIARQGFQGKQRCTQSGIVPKVRLT